MNDEIRQLVELEVRRILSQGELEIRKSIADEISGHRTFLQSQFRTITWGVGILFAVAGAIFVFLFGKSYESARSQIVQEVDSKVIEYRIVETYKDRLEAQVSVILESEKTKKNIEVNVKESVSSYVVGNVGEIIEKRVSEQLEGLDTETLQQTLNRITATSNQVVRNLEQDIVVLKVELENLEASILRDRQDFLVDLRDVDEEVEKGIAELKEEQVAYSDGLLSVKMDLVELYTKVTQLSVK